MALGTGTGLDIWGREVAGPALLVEVPLLASEGGPVATVFCLVLGANMSVREGEWGGPGQARAPALPHPASQMG